MLGASNRKKIGCIPEMEWSIVRLISLNVYQGSGRNVSAEVLPQSRYIIKDRDWSTGEFNESTVAACGNDSLVALLVGLGEVL
jgi:hypothetical protein